MAKFNNPQGLHTITSELADELQVVVDELQLGAQTIIFGLGRLLLYGDEGFYAFPEPKTDELPLTELFDEGKLVMVLAACLKVSRFHRQDKFVEMSLMESNISVTVDRGIYSFEP